MKICELVKILEQLPQDAEILIEENGSYGYADVLACEPVPQVADAFVICIMVDSPR